MGLPWDWVPAQESHLGIFGSGLGRMEGGTYNSLPKAFGYEAGAHRILLAHGFSEQCAGCQPNLKGAARRAHSEASRDRMQRATWSSQLGQGHLQGEECRGVGAGDRVAGAAARKCGFVLIDQISRGRGAWRA